MTIGYTQVYTSIYCASRQIRPHGVYIVLNFIADFISIFSRRSLYHVYNIFLSSLSLFASRPLVFSSSVRHVITLRPHDRHHKQQTPFQVTHTFPTYPKSCSQKLGAATFLKDLCGHGLYIAYSSVYYANDFTGLSFFSRRFLQSRLLFINHCRINSL